MLSAANRVSAHRGVASTSESEADWPFRRAPNGRPTIPTMSEIVTYETEGHIALITLNRPDARNAVNGDVAQGLEAAVDQLEDDDEVWVGILQANTEGQNNPVFCAGADLKAINSGNAAALNTKRGGFAGFAYRERRKPIVVAVDGLATAGGCEIVLACDLAVATTRSAFGLAQTASGAEAVICVARRRASFVASPGSTRREIRPSS